MGVDCLTTGIRLQDADGLISVTQLTVSHRVHWEWPGAAQMAVCKKQASRVSQLQLLFSLFSFLQVAASHPSTQFTVMVVHMRINEAEG